MPFAVLLSIVLLTLFVFWEEHMAKRGKTPLLSMQIFANRQFTSGAITTAIISLGQIGLIFGLPTSSCKGVHDMDALHTGYAMLPLSIALLITAPLGGVISRWFRPKNIVLFGLAININRTWYSSSHNRCRQHDCEPDSATCDLWCWRRPMYVTA